MTRLGRAAILLSLGSLTVRLVWTGGFGWFVQQRMRYPLLAAAILLLVFGVQEVFRSTREQEELTAEVAKRSIAPMVGWLLILPYLVLISVAPTGLGSAAADRVEAFTPPPSRQAFPTLDPSAGPVEMGVLEFLDRAIWDDGRSLEGVTVRLEGLVVNDASVPDGFVLTRFLVSCCAADGVPLQVSVSGTPAIADDTWVIADVVWKPPAIPYQELDGPWVVEAEAVGVTPVGDAPNDPYETPY